MICETLNMSRKTGYLKGICLSDEIEALLIEFPALSYQITRRDISSDDGILRMRSSFTGGGVFECFSLSKMRVIASNIIIKL